MRSLSIINILALLVCFHSAMASHEFTLTDEELSQIHQLLDTHGPKIKRVDSCPLISNGHQGLVNKLQVITHLFKDKCLDKNQRLLDEIINNAQELQDTLNALSKENARNRDINVGSIPANVAYNFDQSGEFVVSGQQIAKLFNNINGIFRSNSCQIDNRRFLSELSDILQGFAQLGLFVPNQNGLVIAGSGLALSSILNILDAALDKRFKFDDPNSRQTFTKLNCAFYDIRKDLHNTGLIDVATDEHKQALVETKFLQKRLQLRKASFEKIHQEKIDMFDHIIDELVQAKFEQYNSVWKNLKDINDIISDFSINKQTRLFLLDKVSLVSKESYRNLKVYIEHIGGVESNFFESMLLEQLEKFFPENLNSLLELNIEDFKNKFMVNFSYNIQRVHTSLNTNREQIKTQIISDYIVDELPLVDYLNIFNRNFQQGITKVDNFQNMLNQLEKKLENIIERQDYRKSEDGSDNFISIMIMYEKISEQIFGRHGYEFLDFTVQEAHRNGEKFRTEAKRLLNILNEKSINGMLLDDPKDIYFCQDAFYARKSWRISEGMIQQAYDFIEANKDLIHSQQLNKYKRREIRRLDRMKMHYKSSEYAKRFLDDRATDLDRDKWKVDATYKLFKKHKTLGKVMLDFDDTKDDAAKLQKIISTNKCELVTSTQK